MGATEEICNRFCCAPWHIVGGKSRRMRHWLDLATGQNPGWYPGEYAHIDKNSVKDRNVC